MGPKRKQQEQERLLRALMQRVNGADELPTFGKSRCLEALTSNGGNVARAVEWLKERARKEKMRPAEAPTAATITAPGDAAADLLDDAAVAAAPCDTNTERHDALQQSIPSLTRERMSKLAPNETVLLMKRLRLLQHPCTAQKKYCKYGENCVLKDMPGSVCTAYFFGCCIYGNTCFRDHAVDGVDIRQHPQYKDLYLKDEKRYRVTELVSGHTLQVAALVEEAELEEPGLDTLVNTAAGDAPPSYDEYVGSLCDECYARWRAVWSSGAERATNPAAGACGSCNRETAALDERANAAALDPTAAAHEEEAHTLTFLWEVFGGAIERVVILQALRAVGGVVPEAQMLLEGMSAAQPEDLLADVNVTAEADAEWCVKNGLCADDAGAAAREHEEDVLTLMSLFPTVDNEAAASALVAGQGDWCEAYWTLWYALQATQRPPPSPPPPAQPQVWGTSALSRMRDRMRLLQMYPNMEEEHVRLVYLHCGTDFMRTVEMLQRVRLPQAPAVGAQETAVGHGARGAPPAAVGVEVAAEDAAATEVPMDAGAAHLQARRDLLGRGDWRRVRGHAFRVNNQRCTVASEAKRAYIAGDGALAKRLSEEGHRLEQRFKNLTSLAMLGLELERQRDGPISELDLHYFHCESVRGVLLRRISLCRAKGVLRLRVVYGQQKRSKAHHKPLYEELRDLLNGDAAVATVAKVESLYPGFLDLKLVPLPGCERN